MKKTEGQKSRDTVPLNTLAVDTVFQASGILPYAYLTHFFASMSLQATSNILYYVKLR
jgi:hypothetical protein